MAVSQNNFYKNGTKFGSSKTPDRNNNFVDTSKSKVVYNILIYCIQNSFMSPPRFEESDSNDPDRTDELVAKWETQLKCRLSKLNNRKFAYERESKCLISLDKSFNF